MTEKASYLGFDFSTQQLKAIVINDQFEVTHQSAVNFDSDLPEFRTHGGVITHEDDKTVTAPTIMWVKALDMLLERLKLEGLDFSTVESLSGAAQQHGSVYWKKNAEQMLKDLSPNKFLHEQLQGCFSVRDSPVWMDSSTEEQCNSLEIKVGGALPLCHITGSRAFERFTGSQIAKLYQNKQSAYDMTERISLISSFGATLFLGKYAPIDLSDGSGMNLLDIQKKDWSDLCLEACAPSLKEKLGTPVPSKTMLGSISSYFVERYGFSEDCKVVAFTGDNPASLAGLQMDKTDLGISLGTSDTMFLWLNEPKIELNGHVFVNPLNSNEYMGLLCFKNGSIIRESFRDECAEGSWQLFNDLLESTPRGNFGNMGFYFDVMEIFPQTIGEFRFNRCNKSVQCFSKEVEVRALIEGQFIAKRVYAEEFGFEFTPTTRIIATGGASTNKALIQVLSDVFNLPVYVLDNENSACLGSALRAKHGLLGNNLGEDFHFQNMFFNKPVGLNVLARPASDASEVYGPMLIRYKTLRERM